MVQSKKNVLKIYLALKDKKKMENFGNFGNFVEYAAL